MEKPAFASLIIGVLAFVPTSVLSESYDSERHRFEARVLTSGLEHPWSLAFLPDGRRLVTERPGRLRLISKEGRLDPQPISGLPRIAAVGQGGLLDVVLHPDYERNGWIYLSYVAEKDGNYGTEVIRARVDGHQLRDTETIFRMQPKSDTTHHFGSRLVFDRKGYLYITLGDRGDKDRAQKLNDHAGSVIRLNADGSIPKDNPFVGVPGAKPEKFTLGHRSQQGAAMNLESGEIWTHEHGPQGGDEINIIRSGSNYGWPVITYGRNYVIGTKIGEGTAKPGMVQPVTYWVPSIAPSGMTFYQGDRFPQWQGNLFVGALNGELLMRIELSGDRVIKLERLLEGKLGRIRDVRTGPDGLIYLLTDEDQGELIRLEPIR